MSSSVFFIQSAETAKTKKRAAPTALLGAPKELLTSPACPWPTSFCVNDVVEVCHESTFSVPAEGAEQFQGSRLGLSAHVLAEDEDSQDAPTSCSTDCFEEKVRPGLFYWSGDEIVPSCPGPVIEASETLEEIWATSVLGLPSKTVMSGAEDDPLSSAVPPPAPPPIAPDIFVTPDICPGTRVLVFLDADDDGWCPGAVASVLPSKRLVEVELDETSRRKCAFCRVSLGDLAFDEESPVGFPVGARIIVSERGEHQVGVVAEKPMRKNRFRYLVFMDDGHAAYYPHPRLRLVALQDRRTVWKRVPLNNQSFIRDYLSEYPRRRLVKVKPGMRLLMEMGGSWENVDVIDVDCSLMVIRHENVTESVYRGSSRLALMFLYIVNPTELEQVALDVGRHSVAEVALQEEQSYNGCDVDHLGTMVYIDPESIKLRRERTKKSSCEKLARCGPQCLPGDVYRYSEGTLGNLNQLSIPMFLGWKRLKVPEIGRNGVNNNIDETPDGEKGIYYVTPCGLKLFDLDSVHRYIVSTRCDLQIDFFDLHPELEVFRQFRADRVLTRVPDISDGEESVPIEAVNAVDESLPPPMRYSRVRIPGEGVRICTDKSFLSCCDCKDDCIDRSKCACIRLTVESTIGTDEAVMDEEAGYKHKRLLKPVQTGIYECNPCCSCSPRTCVNRVAQQPLRNRLQLFKTRKRGWGLRTLHDLPVGGFVCLYVGDVISNAQANALGDEVGDEYFAELDLLETAERDKEGYESGTDELEVSLSISDYDSAKYSDEDETDDEENVPKHSAIRNTKKGNKRKKQTDFRPSSRVATAKCARTLRSRRKDESYASTIEEEKVEVKTKHVPTRQLFSADEEVYVVNASSTGNLGRYLNHSCSPNIFVQNVFIDTHDLRFPWVAFFALHKINAGEELVWDYGYIINTVKDRAMRCLCGSENCRGRLL